MIHALKIRCDYFDSVLSGEKTFEIRENDRDYRVGNMLALNEINGHGEYTGRSALVYIRYIFQDSEYLKENYVAISIKPCMCFLLPDCGCVPLASDAIIAPSAELQNFINNLKEGDMNDKQESVIGY